MFFNLIDDLRHREVKQPSQVHPVNEGSSPGFQPQHLLLTWQGLVIASHARGSESRVGWGGAEDGVWVSGVGESLMGHWDSPRVLIRVGGISGAMSAALRALGKLPGFGR